MEAKGIRLQGERGISRQTIAQGMPECSGCTCMLVCALSTTLHTRPRVQQAPGIPCSLSGGTRFMQTSGALRRENANTHSVVITRLVRNCALGRVIQYSRDVNDRIDRLQRTGCPAFAGHDGRCGAPIFHRHCEPPGRREAPPDDRLREAIHSFVMPQRGLLRFARNDVDRPQRTRYPTCAGSDGP
jgi:hypothetical protein